MWGLFKLLCQPNIERKEPVTLEYALNQLKYNLAPGTLVFLITDLEAIINVNADIFAGIKAKSELILLPVVDPIDSDLPAVNNITCVDNAGSKINVGAVSTAVRKKYHKLWETQQVQLGNIIKKYKLKLITLNTNQAVYRSLNYGLQHSRY